MTFKKNKDFGEFLQNKYKYALAYIIMDYANRYYKMKELLPYPVEWKDERNDDMNQDDTFLDWFDMYFELEDRKTK